MIVNQEHPPLPDRFSDDLKNIYNQLMIKNPDERQRINEILMNPIIKKRSQKLLKELYKEEFSHTVLPGFNLKNAYREMKIAEKHLE